MTRPDGVTMQLAEFVASLKFEDIPKAVVSKAKQHVLDGLGNQLAASTISEPARAVITLVREWGGREEATVVGYGFRTPVPHAALCNAMLGHGVELDDAHGKALTKAGSVLVPSTLAAGEMLGTSGADVLTALVAGYDVTIRIGLAINPSHRKRGFHTTGTASVFGSAAATAKLCGADAERIAYALGLAGMQAAGIQGFLDDPCMAKPFSPGKAAFNGTMAGLLAARGFSGPRTILESKEGFLRAYADEVKVGELTQGLGREFKLPEVGFKPHAACRYAHGPIDAAQILRSRHDLDAAQIEKVIVRCSELSIRQAGRVEVPNLNAAMGSMPFGVALALLRGGNGLTDYAEGFKDRRTHELARRVELVPEKEFGEMGRQAIVEIGLADGTAVSERRESPKGEPDEPLTADELRQKFYSMATAAVDQSTATTLAELVDGLEDLKNAAGILRHVRSERAGRPGHSA